MTVFPLPPPRRATTAADDLASVALLHAGPHAARRANAVGALAARIARALGLDDGEVSFVHQAALLSDLAAGNARGLEPLAIVLRHVTERFDGHGRPGALVGHEIPLASRIVAVAAAHVDGEPLTTTRRRAGERHDPAVVEALATVLSAHAA